jgi:hypothetical protein
MPLALIRYPHWQWHPYLLSELAEAVRPFFALKRGETLMFVLRRKETDRWHKQYLSLAVTVASVA